MSFRDSNSVYENHKVDDSVVFKKEKLNESNGEQLHCIIWCVLMFFPIHFGFFSTSIVI